MRSDVDGSGLFRRDPPLGSNFPLIPFSICDKEGVEGLLFQELHGHRQ